MIPADEWPEWADRHCWDEDGIVMFYGAVRRRSSWQLECGISRIPLPPGHDWRVPVMRPTVKESLTVDLEQFRDAVELVEWQHRGHDNPDFPRGNKEKHAEALRLLALIDGQKGVG